MSGRRISRKLIYGAAGGRAAINRAGVVPFWPLRVSDGATAINVDGVIAAVTVSPAAASVTFRIPEAAFVVRSLAGNTTAHRVRTGGVIDKYRDAQRGAQK